MRITITGPRSVGKTTVSKILANKLGLKYYSSDEIGEKYFAKQGGLDKAIKSGKIGKFIKDSSYGLIRGVYKKDNFVFDLSGGSVSSKKYPEASKKVRETAKKNSVVVGLLPSKNMEDAIEILFHREEKRPHFRNMDKKELLVETEKDYKKFPPLFDELCGLIIYTKNKTPEKISNEIIRKSNLKQSKQN